MKIRLIQSGIILLKLILVILILPLSGYSAQVGKIAGRVIDTASGEPLASANVVVEGSRVGGSSDLDGEYYILNVPPGVYTVTASIVGYAAKRITRVLVNSGRTTWLNFELELSSIQMEEVTVVWEQPPVNIQETSMRSTVLRETLEELPIETVERALEIQAGAVTDASGELHLRGGRSGEIVYYIDGQKVEDPLDGQSPLFINREAVEELTVLSGTFNAEYGDAMSGVVQIITREGGDKFNVSMEYLSPMINSSPYREADWVESESDAVRDLVTGESLYESTSVDDEPTNVVPVEGRMHLSLGGPMGTMKNTTFFLSSLVRNEDNHLPFGFEQEKSLTSKAAWSYGQGGKISLTGGYGWRNYQNYSHAWKYMPEHYHQHFLRDKRMELQWTHSVNRESFFNLRAGIHQQNHDIKIFEEWDDYLVSGYQPEDFTFASYFFDENDWSDTWRESETKTFSIGGNATYQYGNYHQFKAGFEGRLIEIDMLDIREMDIGADNQPQGITDTYQEEPIEICAYIQDKIELSYLVLNAGVRWDYVDPRSDGWTNAEDPESGLAAAPASQQISPRLGLAHPISDDMSLYFAYGHFFQFPHYANLFMNSADLDPDTLADRSFDAVGNRTLKPQRTTAYEVGLKGNLNDDVGFTVTAYYKDITDLVGTKQVRVGTKYNYALFRNIDYASVMGIELGLTRRLVDGWSFEGNYTYSVAKGNSSEPLEGFWNAYYNQPEARQEYYLDFDRRHVLNAMVIWQSGRARGAVGLWDKLISDVTLGVIASFASGLPYTPYTGAGEALADLNSARMDPTMTVDVRFSKTILREPVRVVLLAYIDNLFDFTNDLRVNSRTGEPWESPLIGNQIAFDQLHDPSRVDVPRMVKVGVKVEL
ncbi:MAG: TonB-dependent receptor [candidate division Zixibacteria bacterium]|nr:TonB-dependent receptor [Candidatus Tariuqbacter arcticus]